MIMNNFKNYLINFEILKFNQSSIKNKFEKNLYGDWGLGIGDWGLGIGDWGLGPIPNPQSPIPNPH